MFSTSTFNLISIKGNIVASVAMTGLYVGYSIGIILVIALGLLALGFVWKLIKSKVLGFDRSGMIGGYYYWKKPYKGYHRFHSQQWNMEHME